jgi:3-hydroxybutyryl-CoA dehydrogenase
MVAALARIKPTHDIADMADCDLVVEAVAEDLEIKKPLFAELAEIA